MHKKNYENDQAVLEEFFMNTVKREFHTLEFRTNFRFTREVSKIQNLNNRNFVLKYLLVFNIFRVCHYFYPS